MMPRIALESYGKHLGIAFQLTDDVIDYASDAAVMGKGVGDDFRDGKMTLPYPRLRARQRRGPRVLGAAMTANGRRRGLAHAVSLLRRAVRYPTRSNAPATMAGAPIDALAIFPASKAKAALIEP